jgi:hypothetical protein
MEVFWAAILFPTLVRSSGEVNCLGATYRICIVLASGSHVGTTHMMSERCGWCQSDGFRGYDYGV